MEQPCCVVCGGKIEAWRIKYAKKTCEPCLARKRIAFLLSDIYMSKTFFTLWAKGFFQRLGVFLQEYMIPLRSQTRMLPKAAMIFQEAEKTFRRPEEMSGEWLESQIKLVMRSTYDAPTFFRTFLIKEQLLSPQEEEKRIEIMQAKIESLPQEYRRLVEVYFNERLSRRKRHIEQNAKKPLSLRALQHDLETLTRIIRWFRQHLPDLAGWHMVQEEHILTYLLTLTVRERELVRNDLYVFFRLARKKKLVAHVPVAKYPTRQFPPTYEPLNPEERKSLARLIRENIYSHPWEAFVTALCFYHGLSSSQVLHIKMSDVDIERKIIHIPERPPVYLLAEDCLLLEQFLQQRKDLPYAQQRSHLVISNQHTLKDKPLDDSVLRRKVLSFVKYTPLRLRMTCFMSLAEYYGPQYLVEAFGLSPTHAARFAKIEEYLLEEEVKQQREAFLELSHQLNQSERQGPNRSRRKKER
jgi:integrase